MNSLSRLAVRRPVAVAMFFLAIALLGTISFKRLPIDLLPEVSYPRLVIFTTLDERGPVEIERLLTEPIEAEVVRTPGVERVTAVSRDGVSLVSIRFAWGTDMDFAMLNIRERLDGMRGRLSADASRPLILRVDPEADPIMVLSVAGEDLWETKELAENVFRRRLEQLDGVAQAAVTGGLDREIVVEVDPRQLEVYGVTMSQVSQAINQGNSTASGGTILQGRTRFPLRTIGEFREVVEMEDVVVSQSTDGEGGTLRVRDIGRVYDTFADREVLARYNGREAVGILVFKEAGANTVEVSEGVEEVVGLLRSEFSEVDIEVASSQAGFISESINNVTSALVQGGILAFLVLILFLREPRYPVAVALAIPISMLGTFILMDALGVSLNIMSLGGLALGAGMFMDNSIVVLENIFRHQEEGASPEEAAAKGAEEVSGAITASTLTTIAVFAPIVYVEGVAGELFRDFSFTIASSLLVSLVVALTLFPAMVARFRVGAEAREIVGPGILVPYPRPAGFLRNLWWILRTAARLPLWLLQLAKAVGHSLLRFWWGGVSGFASKLFAPFYGLFDHFADRFHRLMEFALDRRGAILGGTAVLLALTLLAGLTLDRDLLPAVDQREFEVELLLPQGTALFRTDEVAIAIEQVLLADSEVEAVFGTVGRDVRRLAQGDDATGLNMARFQVRMREGASTAEAVERLRPGLDLAASDGTVTLVTGGSTLLGRILGSSESDIAVRIQGEAIDTAFAYADRVVSGIEGTAGITNVRVGAERGQPHFDVHLLRDEAARYGIAASTVASAVEQGMRGVRSTDFVAFDRKIPVFVRLPDELRYDVETLEGLRVDGVPLGELIRVEMTSAPTEIRRVDQGRVVSVLADVERGGLDRAIGEVEVALAGVTLPEDLRVEVGGENEEMHRSFRDLAFAFGLAVLLVYMILAAQFESFLHPATVLAAVPLALIGAILALLVTGEGLNTMSLIGLVILVGVVDNDAIVKVDFIVQARARGASIREAILEAGRVRLRPIVMNTITAVFGLLPMAVGIGSGSELRTPIAIVVIGGLIVATVLTLIVIPLIYSVVEELRLSLSGRREE